MPDAGSSIYSNQEKESFTSHPEGVREGSQGLSASENPGDDPNPMPHPEGMRDRPRTIDLSHPFGMHLMGGADQGLLRNPWLPSLTPSG
jgi:hypothetical protein